MLHNQPSDFSLDNFYSHLHRQLPLASWRLTASAIDLFANVNKCGELINDIYIFVHLCINHIIIIIIISSVRINQLNIIRRCSNYSKWKDLHDDRSIIIIYTWDSRVLQLRIKFTCVREYCFRRSTTFNYTYTRTYGIHDHSAVPKFCVRIPYNSFTKSYNRNIIIPSK